MKTYETVPKKLKNGSNSNIFGNNYRRIHSESEFERRWADSISVAFGRRIETCEKNKRGNPKFTSNKPGGMSAVPEFQELRTPFTPLDP